MIINPLLPYCIPAIKCDIFICYDSPIKMHKLFCLNLEPVIKSIILQTNSGLTANYIYFYNNLCLTFSMLYRVEVSKALALAEVTRQAISLRLINPLFITCATI
jgi:hypothetical protein